MDDRMLSDFHSFVNEHTTGISHVDFNLLQESSQINMTDKVLDKIFDSMMNKYSRIDFGEIPMSRGELVTFKYYDNMTACINILLDMNNRVKDFPEAIVLRDARDGLIRLSPLFKRGFTEKNSYVIIVYNIMVMSLFEGTSAVISSMIDYIKSGNGYEASLSNYRNSGQSILLNSLREFNKTVKDGTMVKYINQAFKGPEVQHEAAIGAAVILGITLANWAKIAGTIWLGTKIIPIIKELVYLYFATMNKISDAAKVQAEFLETNINILTARGADPKVISRQVAIVEMFKKTSRVFAVNHEKAEHSVKAEVRNEGPMNPDDIVI
jgi:hypothetical protein